MKKHNVYMNMDDDYLCEDPYYLDNLLPEDLNYLFESLQIHKKIVEEWKNLKIKLSSIDDEEIKSDIEEFDNFLKYYL